MGKIFLSNSINTSLRIHEDGVNNYTFYHKGSYPNDIPLVYQAILSQASSEIAIWDPHININQTTSDQEIFANINSNIIIRILTCKGLNGTDSFFQSVASELRQVVPRIKNIRFTMRAIDKSSPPQSDWFFHDRFLIIDQANVYLIGSSIGWHTVSHQSTGIYRISDTETSDFIISIFTEYWRNATRNEYTLRFLHP